MPDAPLLESQDSLYALCEATARRVLANQGWELVEVWPAFVAEVVAQVDELRGRPGDTLAKRAERAVTRAYCPRLLAACRAGGQQAARGFAELGRYLHAVARARCRDVDTARESTQRALEIVWRRLDDVREPWAFLGYARVILVHELDPRCRPQPSAPRLVALRPDDSEEPGIALADPHADAAQAAVEQAAEETTLRAAIRACLRSRQQREVILRLFLDGESVLAVAEALGTTPQNVWVLKSRALARLRACPDVARLVEK